MIGTKLSGTRARKRALGSLLVLAVGAAGTVGAAASDRPKVFARVPVPEIFLASGPEGQYGGDIRMGDLDGDGAVEFLVYRCADVADPEEEDALKPCFIRPNCRRHSFIIA